MPVDLSRIHLLNEAAVGPGPVLYWMSRDQRVADNWALLFAQQKAHELKRPLAVIFNLVPSFLGATWRQYSFMLEGLKEVERDLARYSIPFFVLTGDPDKTIPKFVRDVKAGMLVTDFSPLKISRKWKKSVARKLSVPFYEVDAHNIIPCREVSPKLEYAARTIRPKISKRLDGYLTEFPRLRKHSFKWPSKTKPVDWSKVARMVKIDMSVPEINWLKPGEKAARKMLLRFMKERFRYYHNRRNDPGENYQSDLSPYLHFGQIPAQRVALEIQKADIVNKAQEAFLEELIVRRELAENWCFYNPDYDSIEGFPDWAKKTLKEHRHDRREYTYSRKRLEQAKTHDELWNAAQTEMVHRGKMHGYMRMYWAKKILEWSDSPESAFKTAVYLNDKYELDGRDPNGYAGIAWSIGGVHDRPWFEREIYGKIRYMNYDGCKRKFDIDRYIERVEKECESEKR